jgi:HD-GYP domain-containing protein (c-di-GMP phosphodiesterase class II)
MTSKHSNLSAVEEIVVVASIPEISHALETDSFFEHHEITKIEDKVLTVSINGCTQVLLSPEIWKSFDARMQWVQSATGTTTAIVCVGTEKDFQEFPPELKRPDIQSLGLPCSRITLRTALQSLSNFQTLIAHSHAEAKEVDEANQNVKYVMSISRLLNGERDIPKLLNLILQKAREICNADSGTIYTVDSPTDDIKDGKIKFCFTQNHSIVQNLSEFTMPVNEASVVGNAVIHQACINIPDLYQLSPNSDDNPYGARHDSSWDERIGYESHSMLTVPMYDISRNVIGVIQLINRKKDKDIKLGNAQAFKENVIPFDDIDQEMAEIVAQQAGIALENANFQEDIQTLFNGFVNASVTAIEQRDPTTSGHSHRVAFLTVQMAHALNKHDTGIYKDLTFNNDQIMELEYASLLHDFGKLGVREAVLVKAKKLYPEQMELVLTRFELIKTILEVSYLKKRLEYFEHPSNFPMGATIQSFQFERDQKLSELDIFLDFIQKANEPTVLEQGGFEKLKDIANAHFTTLSGDTSTYIGSEELKALSVSRGSLTRDEFAEIQSHVTHTYEFLRQIPWGRRLANVPQIAAKHHEKLDGSGYPHSAAANEIPVQTRIMTIADIFDALTASDRPYKKAVPVDRALDILNMEVKGGKLDKELYDLLIDSKVYTAVLDPSFQYFKAG